MMSQVTPFLDLDSSYILAEHEVNEQEYVDAGEEIRLWSLGKIYNSVSGLYVFGGQQARTPGQYTRMDPETGRTTDERLRRTNEYIHPSVRTRLVNDGPGYDDQATYDPKALRGWKIKTDREMSGAKPVYVWEKKRKGKILPESPLWDVERKLLATSPEMYEFVMENGTGKR